MLTAIVCFLSLAGSHHQQKITVYFTQSDVETFQEDMDRDYPTKQALNKAACDNLQLAIEISRGE